MAKLRRRDKAHSTVRAEVRGFALDRSWLKLWRLFCPKRLLKTFDTPRTLSQALLQHGLGFVVSGLLAVCLRSSTSLSWIEASERLTSKRFRRMLPTEIIRKGLTAVQGTTAAGGVATVLGAASGAGVTLLHTLKPWTLQVACQSNTLTVNPVML